MTSPAKPNFSVEIRGYLETKIRQLADAPVLAARYEAALREFKSNKDEVVKEVLRSDAAELAKKPEPVHRQQAELLMEWAASLRRVSDRRSRLNRK